LLIISDSNGVCSPRRDETDWGTGKWCKGASETGFADQTGRALFCILDSRPKSCSNGRHRAYPLSNSIFWGLVCVCENLLTKYTIYTILKTDLRTGQVTERPGIQIQGVLCANRFDNPLPMGFTD